jgi:hypothetical protein
MTSSDCVVTDNVSVEWVACLEISLSFEKLVSVTPSLCYSQAVSNIDIFGLRARERYLLYCPDKISDSPYRSVI